MSTEDEYRRQGYFPLFISLEGKRALVAGAGKIGSRRARILAEFGAKVTVIAPDGCEDMRHLADMGSVSWRQRAFSAGDLDGCVLVIAATSDAELNDRIVDLCRERGILVNHAGDQNRCDFYFPAVARKEDLVIGITSSGRDHGLVRNFAARLRRWMEEF